MSTDNLTSCPLFSSDDALPPDADRDRDIDVGDNIILFSGKILNPANYDRRSDADSDGDLDVGDVITFFGGGKIGTKCSVFQFTNSTGGTVDGIHIVWSSAIAEIFVTRDSQRVGWSNRVLSADGKTLDLNRPDSTGDLPSGGWLFVVVRGANPVVSSCQWTLEGTNRGSC